MKRFFSFHLYKEGLKQLKLLGIAASIVCVVLSLLIPTVYIMNESDLAIKTVTTISAPMISIPSFFIIIFAPFFTVSMFKFLNDRSKSDFYHAIPYTRECSFFSFMAAVLTWIWGITIVSVALPAIVWAVYPYTTFAVVNVFLDIGVLILGATMMAALMAVSMTLTGTYTSNFAIFALLACFVRVICALIYETLEMIVPVLNLTANGASFLNPTFFMPLALFDFAIQGMENSASVSLFSNRPLIIYSVVVTVVLICVAALLYCARRSEMAGKSAPSRFLQHLYRCAFCMPFALLVAVLIIADEGIAVFIMAVITLIVYYLYELITTHKLKNLLGATPYLLVLVAGMLIFSGSMHLVRTSVLNNVPAGDEIQSVSLCTANGYRSSYESYQTANCSTNDPQACRLASEALKYSVEQVKNGTFDRIYDSVYAERYMYTGIRITTANGSVLNRNIKLLSDDYESLNQAITLSQGYREAALLLPQDKEITSIWIQGSDGIIAMQDLMPLWQTFCEEYAGLSDEEKLATKSMNFSSDRVGYYDTDAMYATNEVFRFVVNGETDYNQFQSYYAVNASTPKTAKMYAQMLWENIAQDGKTALYDFLSRIASNSMEEMLEENRDMVLWMETQGAVNLNLNCKISTDAVNDGYYDREYLRAQKLARFFLDNWNVDDFDPSKPYVSLIIYNYMETEEDDGIYVEYRSDYVVLINLPDDYSELENLQEK